MIREIIMNNNREKTKIQIKKTINNKDNNKILCLNAAKIINKIKKKNTQNNHIQYQMMTIFKNYRLTNRVYRINKIINILKINLYIIMIISYTEIKIIQTNIIRNTKKMQIKIDNMSKNGRIPKIFQVINKSYITIDLKKEIK